MTIMRVTSGLRRQVGLASRQCEVAFLLLRTFDTHPLFDGVNRTRSQSVLQLHENNLTSSSEFDPHYSEVSTIITEHDAPWATELGTLPRTRRTPCMP